MSVPRQLAGAGLPARSRWMALPVLLTGTFLIVLDFFIVNVALPAIQAGLGARASEIEWVVAGYGLAFAVLIISAGRIGDQFGRRRVFSLGVTLFTFASAACALAPSATALIVARVVQGAAAALISPTVLAIIGVTYTGSDRARAISIYGIVMGLATAGGQVIGGALIAADIAGIGWRAIFLINVPVGIAALILTPRLVPESRAEDARALDPVGMALITAALAGFVLPLIQGRAHGWPAWSWLGLAAAGCLLPALAVHQRWLKRNGGAPLLDPALFEIRAFRSGLLTQLVYWCSMASFFLVLALYLQEGRGLNALHAGMVFSILVAGYLTTSLRAPALTLRYGRRLIAIGACAVAVGDALLLAAVAHVAAGGSIGWLVPGLVLIGAGQGLCITPLTTTVLAHADARRAGLVSGALSTMQQAGNALGVAVTGLIFFGALQHGYAHAFELALGELACLLLAVALLTRLLPPRRAAS